ncbi:DUF3887 domain-containing protein [Mycolicibacterium komossense]|nr:DUF3887 domain-containing protein [Mycolicibacterium komossense]
MVTVISGFRVNVGTTHGDVRVNSGGKLLLVGNVDGALTIARGGYAFIIGMTERLVVEPGGTAKHRGYCTGDAINEGGNLVVMRGAVINGTLHGRSFTQVDPGAKIGHYSEPIDSQTGQAPLPDAVELARTVINDLMHARWAEVRARFDDTMHAELSEEELAAPWAQIAGSVGNYLGHRDTDVARAGDRTITNTPLAFEAGDFVARITFRDDQTISGLYILNPDLPGSAGGSATK